jgi:hypothetical protein
MAPSRQKRAGGPLEDPGQNEHDRARRRTGQSRGKGETGSASDEHPPPSEPITESTRDEIERGQGERVGEHDPLLRAESNSEVTPDLGQRDGDRRHGGHRRAENRGDEA